MRHLNLLRRSTCEQYACLLNAVIPTSHDHSFFIYPIKPLQPLDALLVEKQPTVKMIQEFKVFSNIPQTYNLINKLSFTQLGNVKLHLITLFWASQHQTAPYSADFAQNCKSAQYSECWIKGTKFKNAKEIFRVGINRAKFRPILNENVFLIVKIDFEILSTTIIPTIQRVGEAKCYHDL